MADKKEVLDRKTLDKYRKQIEGNLEGTVAHWNIKLNGEDIHREMTNIITPVINESNYTKTGVVAPGTTGYFNLAIDATDVDVDFTYTISFESLNSLEDIKVTSYEINNDGNTCLNLAYFNKLDSIIPILKNNKPNLETKNKEQKFEQDLKSNKKSDLFVQTSRGKTTKENSKSSLSLENSSINKKK